MENSGTGYSGKPLFRKLGIKPDLSFIAVNAPDQYLNWLDSDFEVVTGEQPYDLVHVFSKSQAELAVLIAEFLPRINSNGAIWISWPKKSAKVATDITEDVIRQVIFPLGMVDVKVCSVSHVWSGLKTVIRKENRK